MRRLCAREIDNWMCCNKLKLNGDKSELLVIIVLSIGLVPCYLLLLLAVP